MLATTGNCCAWLDFAALKGGKAFPTGSSVEYCGLLVADAATDNGLTHTKG